MNGMFPHGARPVDDAAGLLLDGPVEQTAWCQKAIELIAKIGVAMGNDFMVPKC